ncbi:MAG TPA: cobalamin-independent methionine synthase II family protein [Allosphingosinicella sp.]|nr:cobalamin-independent methionine synthase II family protein [Allosphingosinicella sp.]
MLRSEERILTTHVGSIGRPPELLELSNFLTGPPKDLDEYERRLTGAVKKVVAQQVAHGIDIVNDGEFGKESWANYIMKRISGFESRPDDLRPVEWLGSDRTRFAEFMKTEFPRALTGVPTDACIGPIAYRDRRGIERALANLKAAADAAQPLEVFMTAVAPASTAYDGINEYYENERDYVFAIAEALREEYLAIHAAGFLVQVDDALLANMYDHLVRQSPERYREWAELRIEALNHALRDIPEDRIRYHVCFGSWHVPHISDAPLEAIVDLIVRVKAGAYAIEAANPRHEHEWRIWRERALPADKVLMPGIIDTSTNYVEHPELVAQRIVRFAEAVGRERVIASTDCGFGTAAGSGKIDPGVAFLKLGALVEGAARASQQLWR